MEFVIICIVLEIFGLIERCVEGGLSCPTGRSQRKLGRTDFCDMCIRRKSLTTNLSKTWGRDSWRQRGILPNAVKKYALPSLSIHRRALVWQSALQQQTLLFTSALSGFLSAGICFHCFITITGTVESHNSRGRGRGRGRGRSSSVKMLRTFVCRERNALVYSSICLDAHARWHSDVSPSASSSQAPLTLVIVARRGSWPQ